MSLNLKELIIDEDLTARLKSIEKIMKEDYLKIWYIHFPHYTDHGAAHCESVEAKLNELIPDEIKKELNEYEIFFLLSAVWMHDIGMTSFDECEGITREKHHELGRVLIRKDKIKGIDLREPEKVVIGELVFGHCAPIDKILEITRIERKNKKNEPIRIKFLACLLRLADVCDISHNRTSDLFLECKGIDPTSKVHHELHQRVSSIEFNNKSNKIIVHATVKSEKDKELLEKTIINNIQKELCASAKILHPQITYIFVELRINYDSFKNEINVPPEFYQQLKFHLCFECAKLSGPSQICEHSYEKNIESERKIEHFDENIPKKSKIPVLFGSPDIAKLQETFSSRWITTFNVVNIRSFDEIKQTLEEGLPAIIVGNRDSGKTSFVYAMLKTFISNNWHIAVYEKGETLEDEDYRVNSPLLIAIDDLHTFEIAEQDEIFKLYKKAIKNKCGFLVTYRLENEDAISHLWNNEISQINTKYLLPDLSKKELKQIIEVHSKEKEIKISDENIEQFAWQVSKYSNMPAHIAYSFVSKEKGDTFSSDDIKRVPPELNKLIESVIMKLDAPGEKVMKSFKLFNLIDGENSRFVFKEELKYAFLKIENSFSDIEFSKGMNSLSKLGIIQEIDSTICTTPKTGFLDQISLEFDNISIKTIEDGLKINYFNIFNKIDLNNKENNQAFSIALLSVYERMKKIGIPMDEFIKILVRKNIELAKILIFKKAFDESKVVQINLFKSILPYLKERNDKKIEDLYALATAYKYVDEIDNSIATLNEILLINSNEGNAYHLLGHSFLELENHSQAIEYMEKAANLDSKYFVCLGDIYKQAGNNDKAIESLNKSIENDPKEPSAYNQLGNIFSEANKHSQAIEYMEKAANLDSKYFVNLGYVYRKAEDIDKAIESFNKAIEHDPKDASAYHELGHIFSKKEKHSQAIEYMEKAANLDPHYKGCIVDVYRRAGDIDKAIESFNKAIEHDPKDSSAYHSLGHAFLMKKQHSQAIEYMEKAANLDPKYFVCLGGIFNKAGDIDKAIESFNKALENDPKEPSAYNQLGNIFSEANKHSQAIEYTEKAANLDPKYFVNLGYVYRKAGNIDKAIESYNKAIEHDSIDVYDSLGAIYADELHNYSKAIYYYNKILEKTPNLNSVKANLIEAFLGAGQYDDLNIYASEILNSSKEANLILNVKFIVICSKLFQKSEINKEMLISDFIEYYDSLPDTLENDWNYSGIIYLIEKTDFGIENYRNLLLSLINLLRRNISIDYFKKNFLS